MKKITCLVLAVILLSFIVANGNGKITILHEGRVSGKPKRRSRRQTVRKRPSTPANEDNDNRMQDRRRPVVRNHVIMYPCYCFAFTLVSLFVICKRTREGKKLINVLLFLLQNYSRWHESPHWMTE